MKLSVRGWLVIVYTARNTLMQYGFAQSIIKTECTCIVIQQAHPPYHNTQALTGVDQRLKIL
jgi:hypothetical protein